MNVKTANDLLELVNSLIEGKMYFLSRMTDETFSILKILDKGMGSQIEDGFTINISESYCQQIFLGNQEPLLINDAHRHPFTCQLPLTSELNIQSYVGVPIFYRNGEMYGTLCALDNQQDHFSDADLKLLEKCSNLFSYVIELEKKSTFDTLTNLYNRNYLYDHFDSTFKAGTLLSLDLDGFKEVNDSYGHDVGDLVLAEVGSRIKQQLTSDDMGFRLGGDEFAIILANFLDEDTILNRTNELLALLANWRDFKYENNITVSIGIVRFPEDGNDLQTLLKKADEAMYVAKKNGKNRYYVYE
ncbi:sensor domain-containing diguanylate cyclase [Halalkalibacter sp. APA_J-10(15)]|uniref:sensor domain-containing diguanylate cyclase n=1 Tax=unclassified Halalkalibacter TaxID=2893063 RepID=UPI001FF63B49|nr:sensor domain-containing diguanylate cyclase [Halalkalibacter sp. APA_J-10(15)]MCK0472823.1 sensor domain-containing diguanylate cyclase [Halalkalibacter sp. APA_J-10(15)]